MAVWDRIEEPAELPSHLSIGGLHNLGDSELAELLRSNLLPRSDRSQARARWRAFWTCLAHDPGLLADARSILGEFFALAEAELAANPDNRRARRFKDLVSDRIQKLEGHHSASELIEAIRRHQHQSEGEPTAADRELWAWVTR